MISQNISNVIFSGVNNGTEYEYVIYSYVQNMNRVPTCKEVGSISKGYDVINVFCTLGQSFQSGSLSTP